MDIGKDTAFTWLGHATFRITTPGGKHLLIDPWVDTNPACPEEARKIDSLDLILITHGHSDHMADAVPVAQRTGAKTLTIFELATYLGGRGVLNTIGMNKGGTTEALDGIRVTMVSANHSCGIVEDGKIVYGGEAVGYVIELENGFRIYHAGDTCVFGDMKIIGELYRPELVMLPIGDFYTMSPREAAYACRLLGAKIVIPMHYATFPVLTGTPQALRQETADIPGLRIIEMKPGQTVR
jgi:L-ascorbate metabolism protein UlaG (beta-lactamase superfamily)